MFGFLEVVACVVGTSADRRVTTLPLLLIACPVVSRAVWSGREVCPSLLLMSVTASQTEREAGSDGHGWGGVRKKGDGGFRATGARLGRS